MPISDEPTNTDNNAKRSGYVNNLILTWVRENRPDVVATARMEGFTKFPGKSQVTTNALPPSMKALKKYQ